MIIAKKASGTLPPPALKASEGQICNTQIQIFSEIRSVAVSGHLGGTEGIFVNADTYFKTIFRTAQFGLQN